MTDEQPGIDDGARCRCVLIGYRCRWCSEMPAKYEAERARADAAEAQRDASMKSNLMWFEDAKKAHGEAREIADVLDRVSHDKVQVEAQRDRLAAALATYVEFHDDGEGRYDVTDLDVDGRIAARRLHANARAALADVPGREGD